MDSLKKLYRIGNGPSSSHTMGPGYAANIFLNRNPNAAFFQVNLYGSLAATGKGHLTDVVLKEVLGQNTIINFDASVVKSYHPNAMEFYAFNQDNQIIDKWLVYSVGGGQISDGTNICSDCHLVYPQKNMQEVLDYCASEKINFYEYVLRYEKDILEYLSEVFDAMVNTVENGFVQEEVLPGPLKVKRRAKDVYQKFLTNHDLDTLVIASALSASEENASGKIVVTAPTCGACGVVAGVIYANYRLHKYSKATLLEALAVGGVIGNLVKQNASISGAEVGCQGEVGVACSMAAGMVAYLEGGTNKQVEYAAEIALEHHLGMTCDPVLGYVQIPCIERNALSSKTAISCAEYALLTNGEHYISFDSVVESMRQTGMDLKEAYKETSRGGLAKARINNEKN